MQSNGRASAAIDHALEVNRNLFWTATVDAQVHVVYIQGREPGNRG